MGGHPTGAKRSAPKLGEKLPQVPVQGLPPTGEKRKQGGDAIDHKATVGHKSQRARTPSRRDDGGGKLRPGGGNVLVHRPGRGAGVGAAPEYPPPPRRHRRANGEGAPIGPRHLGGSLRRGGKRRQRLAGRAGGEGGARRPRQRMLYGSWQLIKLGDTETGLAASGGAKGGGRRATPKDVLDGLLRIPTTGASAGAGPTAEV